MSVTDLQWCQQMGKLSQVPDVLPVGWVLLAVNIFCDKAVTAYTLSSEENDVTALQLYLSCVFSAR